MIFLHPAMVRQGPFEHDQKKNFATWPFRAKSAATSFFRSVFTQLLRRKARPKKNWPTAEAAKRGE